MFHNQYSQVAGDSESATLNSRVLDLPLDRPNSHTAQYPYSINTPQRSRYGHLTCASIDGIAPTSHDTDLSQLYYATPDTALQGTLGYWGDFPINDMVLRPQGPCVLDNQ